MTSPATPSTSVEGVVWDFGGVLVDWDPFPAVAHGVGEDAAQRFFARSDGFDFGSWNYACDAGRTWEEALAILERDHPEHAAAGRSYVDNFAHSLVGEIPGTHELLRELHLAGVRQFGLTNWSDELFHGYAPERYPTMALLEEIIVSGTEKLAKPDPAIYQLLPARTGLPLDALVFIDDVPANIETARSLGMHGIVFRDAEQLRSDLRRIGLPA